MSGRLEALRNRAIEIRKELQLIDAEIQAEEDRLRSSETPKDDAPPPIHHRPSYSLFGGTENSDSLGLRQLSGSDNDFAAFLGDHPELKIDPIGAYNHWDRRECAVTNAADWQARCETYMKDISVNNVGIPKVIHQIWIGPREPPCLWMDSFRVSYCEKYPDWSFQMWSDEQVADLPMFNNKIYVEEKMWQCKADILRLEFLWHHGGLYVDADMISVGLKSLDPIIEMGKTTGFVIAYEPDTKDKPYFILGNSVIACTPHHPLILMLILFLKQTYYQKRYHEEVFAVTGPVMYTKCLIDTGMPLAIAAQELLYPAFHFVPNPDAIDYSHFPNCLMFQFGYTCSGLEGYVKRRNRCRKPRSCPFHSKRKLIESLDALNFMTDVELYAQVPISLAYLEEFAICGRCGEVPANGALNDRRAVLFITDGDFLQYKGLRMELPKHVNELQSVTWDALLLGIEWSTGSEEVVKFNVPLGGRPRNSSTFGVVVNASSKKLDILCPILGACVGEKGFDPSPLFDAANAISLWFSAEKFRGTPEESRIMRNMPVVHEAFHKISGHSPPLHYDRSELHGDRMKGWINERVVFELHVEANGSITFRAWNDDNSPNCEMRASSSKVEWMKVFFNHQVVFEAQNKPLPS